MSDEAASWRALEPGTVHVWSLHLAASPEALDIFTSMLSADELARALRLAAGPVRDRFCAARGGLRILLGGYLERDPAAIEFAYGQRGKPALADSALGLRFNLAHSEDFAVYAFAAGPELGIDVESLRRMPDVMQIARRFFAREEFEALAALPADQRLRSFYQAWTRKEAYVKAVGDGLHTPLDSFCVTLEPGRPARLIALGGSSQAASAWQLHHLEPAAGYVGALAYAGLRMEVEAIDPVGCEQMINRFRRCK